MVNRLKSRQLEIADDAEAIFEHFDEQRWTDGLPVIPPTPERVQRFIDFAKRDPAEEIGVIPPLKGVLTVEKVAVNAVMAGCRPEYMPVLLTAAAIAGTTKEPMQSAIKALQQTSHSVHPLLIVNGPIRKTLGITSGENGTKVSWRANATIGRAIQLLIMNLGGSPGVTGWKTWGFYVCRGYCMAENEEQSPWEPFHVEHGFSPQDSTVTLLLVEPPRHMEIWWEASQSELLRMFAKTMCGPASRDSYGTTRPTLIFGPDQARGIAEAGFTKKDVKRFLYEHARTPFKEFGANPEKRWKDHHKKYFTHSPEAMVPMVSDPEEFNILVIGGPGPQTLHVPHHQHPIEHCIRRIEV